MKVRRGLRVTTPNGIGVVVSTGAYFEIATVSLRGCIQHIYDADKLTVPQYPCRECAGSGKYISIYGGFINCAGCAGLGVVDFATASSQHLSDTYCASCDRFKDTFEFEDDQHQTHTCAACRIKYDCATCHGLREKLIQTGGEIHNGVHTPHYTRRQCDVCQGTGKSPYTNMPAPDGPKEKDDPAWRTYPNGKASIS